MTQQHQVIEELMAGYAVGSLSEEDANEARRLLKDHVPTCSQCLEDLQDWRDLTSRLALSLDPVAPPKMLLPAIAHDGDRLRVRSRAVRNFFVAATVVAVIGLGGLAATQDIQSRSDDVRAANIQTALDAAARPDSTVAKLGPLTVISAPEKGQAYVYGEEVPLPTEVCMTPEVSSADCELQPASYRLWRKDSTGSYRYIGGLSVRNGSVFARVSIGDLSQSKLVVSTEVAGSTPLQPSTITWRLTTSSN